MESASLQSAKSWRRADMNRAMESAFAEYQKELLEEYEIFALDAGYESGEYSEDRFLDRLSYYGADGMEQEIVRVQLLTDNHCAAFEEQVARYVEHRYGIGSLDDALNPSEEWEEQETSSEQLEEIQESITDELDAVLAESETELPTENNPLPLLESLRVKPLIELVMPEGVAVSEKEVSLSKAASHRSLQSGRGDFNDVAQKKTVSKLGLGEYLLSHFPCAVGDGNGTGNAALGGEGAGNLSQRSEGAVSKLRENNGAGMLDYELEYIIAGKKSDRENLDAVLKKILMLRFVPNYAFLQTDAASQAQAEALALSLATAAAIPAAAEALTQVLLLAWAFGESIMDLRALMKGNRVPVVKDSQSWQLSIGGLMKLGTSEEMQDGKTSDSGLSYREYMRGLICLGDQTSLCRRCVDIVEWNLQTVKGLTWFRADQCISKVEVQSTLHLRRGITYQFSTYYGYR